MKKNHRQNLTSVHLILKTCHVLCWFIFCIYTGLFLSATRISGQDIQSPESFLGFKIGTDRKLADYEQITNYFQMLAAASDRIILHDIGPTTENRPMVLAIISDTENLRVLPKYQGIQEKLYDPEGLSVTAIESLIVRGKTIVSINCSIHSTEVGASQMAMQFAYDYATATDSKSLAILQNVIILLVPVHNPDGLDMVVNWYRKYVGTEYEGSRLPRLYHKYCGHDLNRDWFMLTQRETQQTVKKIYNVWHPQIVLDLHQMGTKAPRAFVPPYTNPVDPSLHPIQISEIAMLGHYIQSSLTAAGMAGVITAAMFDAWSPSRAYMHYQGGIRILAEVASCNIATPINVDITTPDNSGQTEIQGWNYPLPWLHGDWSLADIISYKYHITDAVLTHAAQNRIMWLRNFSKIQYNAIHSDEAPFAYIIPQQQWDTYAVKEMLETLQKGNVRIHQLTDTLMVNGRQFFSGDFVLPARQPARRYLHSLLTIPAYPESTGKRAYDATGHHLGYLYGVKVFEIANPRTLPMKRISHINVPAGRFIRNDNASRYIALSKYPTIATKTLNHLLGNSRRIFRLIDSLQIADVSFAPGSFIVSSKIDKASIGSLNAGQGVSLYEIPASKLPLAVKRITKPRIGLYQSWAAQADFGWTRFILEQYGFSVENIISPDIYDRRLSSRYTCIILTDQSAKSLMHGYTMSTIPPEYKGGLGKLGTARLQHYVKQGGTLIAFGRACALVKDEFSLDVDILHNEKLWAPGPQLKFRLNTRHPIAQGMPAESSLIFSRSPVFQPIEADSIAWFPDEPLRLSGAIKGEDVLHGKPVILKLPYGNGNVILFSFSPCYRAQTQTLFKLLFNALYDASASTTTLTR